MVLEGGSIDVNGQGAVLTTEECLLDPFVQVRNPGFRRADYERILLESLGAHRTVWLGRGIAGDDTHGHVDDLCRFVDEKTIVLCQEDDAGDPNHRPLAENRERLQDARLGRRLEARRWWTCPCRRPSSSTAGACPRATPTSTSPTPASWSRPSTTRTTGWPWAPSSELIPDRPVVGIHAVDLVWGLGTLHCLTQQQPRV